MALILEVLDTRTGEVRSRRRIDGDVLTLGRGYDNDVVLDDPYVDVRHARIGVDETGAPVIDDLGSVNGLLLPDATRRSRVALQPGTVVRVGRTRLRIRDSEAPLPPALRDPHARAARVRVPEWLGTWWGQLSVLGVATAVVAWATWLGTYGESTGAATIGMALGFLVLVTPWAGIWAVAGRVVVHRFRFMAHVAVASAITVAAIAYGRASTWGAFLFPDNALGVPFGIVIGVLLVAVLIASHLALASNLPPRRRWAAGFMTAAVIFAVGAAAVLVDDGAFSDVPEFSPALKPLPATLLPTGSIEEFTVLAGDLRRQVDEMVPPSR